MAREAHATGDVRSRSRMRRMLFCAFALLGCTAESAAIAGRADDGEDELDLTPKLSAINILIAPNVSYTIKASPPGLCVQWETNVSQ